MTANVLKRMKQEEKGFTLIELLAVIVILGIIAAIAVPMINNVLNDSREDADLATARQIIDAARLYVTTEEEGNFDGQVIDIATDLLGLGYLDDNITLPSTGDQILDGEVSFDADGDFSIIEIQTDADADPEKDYTPAELNG